MKYIVISSSPELVGYEWITKEGVKFSIREEGLVEAKISDWDKALISEISKRKIVHIYWIKENGIVKPYGKVSAMKKLGLVESLFKKKTKPFIDKIKAQESYFMDAIRLLQSRNTEYIRTRRSNNIVSDNLEQLKKSAEKEIYGSQTLKENIIFFTYTPKMLGYPLYSFFHFLSDGEDGRGYCKGYIDEYLLRHPEIRVIKL